MITWEWEWKGTITPSACSWTPAIISKSCFDNTRLDPHNYRNGSRSGCMYWLQIWTSFEGIFGVTPNTCVMKVCCSSAHQKSTFLAEKQKSKDTLYTVLQPRYPSTSQEVVSAITSFMFSEPLTHLSNIKSPFWATAKDAPWSGHPHTVCIVQPTRYSMSTSKSIYRCKTITCTIVCTVIYQGTLKYKRLINIDK